MMSNKSVILFGVFLMMLVTACMKPMARFSMSAGQAEAPATITFTNKSEKAESYLWNFGDGTQSTDSVASHQYAHSGKYVVSLKAIKGTKSNTMTQPLEIHPPAKCLIEISTDYGVMI